MTVVGLLINPIAGMGGPVGLKGTDGQVEEARRRGAVPHAQSRAVEALNGIDVRNLLFLTCAGAMGEDTLAGAGISSYRVVATPGEETTAEDTKQAVRVMGEAGVDLILFCGGDGTARDIFDVVGGSVPMLGIPAGVKMYSGVFATHPRRIASIIERLDTLGCRDAEIMDVDEEAYRQGCLSTRLYGYARVPFLPAAVQGCKAVMESVDEERAKSDIARFISEIMREDTLYILGAGTTTRAIGDQLGLSTTLLGIDAIKAGEVVCRDMDEHRLSELVDHEKRVKLILSPIGAQGFILGRGTQQISPSVICGVGTENIVVVATPGKLAHTPVIYIDSGDPALNDRFHDSLLVVTGYRIGRRMPLKKS